MTIRHDMREAVSRASDALDDSVDAVRGFLRRCIAPDGGFAGRDGRSDLYYTVFGLEASLALNVALSRERIAEYLGCFGAGESLDLVHLACLVRCRANVCDAGGKAMDDQTRQAVMEHLQQYRAGDGGFSTAAHAERGNAYGSLLAVGMYQDLGATCPDPDGLIESVNSLRMPDAGCSNESTVPASATTATAAALSILHYSNRPVPQSAIRWLLDQAHPLGGFSAIRLAQGLVVPDLLSTATALHALSLAGVSMEGTKDKHLDYLDTLWSTQGGFRGHWADETVDCEYTYYGLLSLGCLAK
jgi:prenyltransferase beta subunit